MSRRAVTLVFPYYENPEMLGDQLDALRQLPAEVRASLNLIVVDDGSPKAPAEPVANGFLRSLDLASVQLFRVDVDVRWNWLTCRNIGVANAPSHWVLLTDIDHMVPEATFRRIQERKLDPTNAYRFSRVDAPDLTPYKPHPNSWLFTRELFDKIGGYDERFSGFYGTDGEFRDRVRANSAQIIMLDDVLVRYPREVIADASTTQYGRKEKQDHDGVTRIRARIAKEGGRPVRLSFPFHKVF
jgi:hypothetical protein